MLRWRKVASQEPPAYVPDAQERDLVARALVGDADAIGALVDRYDHAMGCVAAAILVDRSEVADVVQEAWIRVFGGLHKFEFRASLKTWILRITANAARTTASKAPLRAEEPAGPTVDPARFSSIGRWRDPPADWTEHWGTAEPEAALLRQELAALAQRELDALPSTQRAVVTLRDVEGLDSMEICAMLEISETNQRVLLHRGRARVRAAVERELKRR